MAWTSPPIIECFTVAGRVTALWTQWVADWRFISEWNACICQLEQMAKESNRQCLLGLHLTAVLFFWSCLVRNFQRG